MNKTNVVIIEDEIPAARLLRSMLLRLRPEWNVEVLPGNIEESVQWFETHEHPDLIFLDIQLSDGISFEFLAEAKPQSIIIFTTAYDEYAIRAFSVNSIDYILKPIHEERLIDAIVKYESICQDKQTTTDAYLDNIIDTFSQTNKKRFRTRFLIAGSEKLWTLQTADIAYFYSVNRITLAVTHSGKEHIIDLTLDKLMEQLDPDTYFRANRQTIIQVDAIKKIEPYFNGKLIVITQPASNEKITISKEKVSSFKSWLNY